MIATATILSVACVDRGGFAGPEKSARWDELGVPVSESGVPGFAWRQISSAPYREAGRLDAVSKMAAAAVELLGSALASTSDACREDAAITFGSEFGSLQTDIDFYRTVGAPGGASPALFTYTLPSAAMAEVAIRHGMQGENLCFVGTGAAGVALAEAVRLVAEGGALRCLCLAADALGETTVDEPAGASGAASRASAVALLLGPADGTMTVELVRARGEDEECRSARGVSTPELCRASRALLGRESGAKRLRLAVGTGSGACALVDSDVSAL
jgi:3-oxoacyl-(acyl-carrier-protein) synthase